MITIVKSCLSSALDGVINKIGATSLFTTIGLFFASGSGAIELSQAANGAWGMAEWLGVLAGVGTTSFILKNLASFRNEYLGAVLKKLDIEEKEKKAKEKDKQ
jgi:hypothetical protein